MKKKLLLITLLFIGFIGISQTVVFSDDFNDEDISDWTLVDSDGDGNNWFAVQVTNNGTPVGTPVLRSASWISTGPLTPDNWAITPAIDLTSYAVGSATLNWLVDAPDADWDAENYTVYVATSNSINDLINSTVTFSENTLDGVNTLTARTLDLSSLVGNVVYVAFRHFNVTDQFVIHVDDVEVTAQAAASVSDNQIANFKYFVKDNTLNLNASTNFSAITVYDITGKKVLNQNLNNSNERIFLNINEGIYIAKVTTEDNKFKTFKFIVR